MKRIFRNIIIFSILFLMTGVLNLYSQKAVVELTGSGATFPEPFYKKIFDEYNKKTGIKVNYQGIGSSGGIKQMTDKVVDFGGTDAFMNDSEIKAAGSKIIHIPTCIGAVVLVYNLPGLQGKIRFSPNVL